MLLYLKLIDIDADRIEVGNVKELADVDADRMGLTMSKD
jgi:hypothetical protein